MEITKAICSSAFLILVSLLPIPLTIIPQSLQKTDFSQGLDLWQTSVSPLN